MLCWISWPLQPGWRGIVAMVWPGSWAGGCQTCRTHISVTAWQIFSVRSSVELSRPAVVHSDCQGQFFKKLYLRNGRASQHGTKGIWVDRMLYLLCDLEQWLWPGFWRSNSKKLYHRNRRVAWHGTKRMWVDRMLDPSCDFKLWPHPYPWPWPYFRNGKVDWLGMKLLQFPTCWSMNGLFVQWYRGWGVLSFSERLVWHLVVLIYFHEKTNLKLLYSKFRASFI